MAKASIESREVTKTVTENVDTVILELSLEEAEHLRTFLGAFDINAVEVDKNGKPLNSIFWTLWKTIPTSVNWLRHDSYREKIKNYNQDW